MDSAVDSIDGLRELSERELLEIEGGGWGKDFLLYLLKKAADCMIDDWEQMKDCFEEGMAEAKG